MLSYKAYFSNSGQLSQFNGNMPSVKHFLKTTACFDSEIYLAAQKSG